MAIFDTLRILKEELQDYVRGVRNDPTASVALRNIAFVDTDEDQIPEGIIITLVNLEEEKRLKNYPSTRVVNSQTESRNPPITVNAYLLFCAKHNNYEEALKYLSHVIEFFQGKLLFTPANSPGLDSDQELHMEIHTLNFEQINDLWGSLGGKQLPFVMYKMRNIRIERDMMLQAGPPITDLSGDGQII